MYVVVREKNVRWWPRYERSNRVCGCVCERACPSREPCSIVCGNNVLKVRALSFFTVSHDPRFVVKGYKRRGEKAAICFSPMYVCAYGNVELQ